MSTEWISTLHQYLFCIGLSSLMINLFIAGFILPFYKLVCWSVQKYCTRRQKKIPHFFSRSNRYSNSSHWFSLSFCFCLLALIIILLIIGCTKYYGRSHFTFVEFFQYYWNHICDYWTHQTELQPIYYAFLMTMCFAFLDIFFTTLFAIANPWPKEDLKDPADLQEREEAKRQRLLTNAFEEGDEKRDIYESPHADERYRHAFVVVTHNSSDILAASARAILRHVEPWQLFFADNGSTEEEELLSDKVCLELTEEYRRANPFYTGPPINISHIRKGSKTWAQYAAIEHLAQFVDRVKDDPQFKATALNYVTIMDDDVILPYNWSQKKVNREFDKNSLTVAVAYPLKADNPEDSIWARYQDLEYLMGDAERATQDFLGTNLFCSGACATFKLELLSRVLERHDATFHGEDIEMGWITHKLSGRTKLEGVKKSEIEDINTTQHRVALLRDCVVPTTVPICYHHFFDYLPVDLGKKLPGGRSCDCGEASLFYQRNRSWDIANHSFFFRFIKLVFSPGAYFSRIKFFVRVVALWKVIGILREYVFIFGIFLYLAMNRSWISVLSLLSFTVDALIIWWGTYCWVLHIQNMRFRQSYLQCSLDILITYPFLFLFNLTTYVRPIAAIYNVCYYWPFVSFAPQIKKQLQKDDNLRKMVDGSWDIEKCCKTMNDIEQERFLSINGSTIDSSSDSSEIESINSLEMNIADIKQGIPMVDGISTNMSLETKGKSKSAGSTPSKMVVYPLVDTQEISESYIQLTTVTEVNEDPVVDAPDELSSMEIICEDVSEMESNDRLTTVANREINDDPVIATADAAGHLSFMELSEDIIEMTPNAQEIDTRLEESETNLETNHDNQGKEPLSATANVDEEQNSKLSDSLHHHEKEVTDEILETPISVHPCA